MEQKTEKKKRWRPSLTAYRELERKLAEANETIRLQDLEIKHQKEDYEQQSDALSQQISDSDGWRDKYRKLKDSVEGMKKGVDGDRNKLVLDCDSLKKEVERLITVVDERDKELASVREANKTIRDLNESLCDEIEYLKNRGLFARLFNKI